MLVRLLRERPSHQLPVHFFSPDFRSCRKRPLFPCKCKIQTLRRSTKCQKTRKMKTRLLSSRIVPRIIFYSLQKRGQPVLRLNVYKLSNENWEWKLSEKDVLFTAMTPYVRPLEQNVSSLKNANRLLQEINSYQKRKRGEQGNVVVKNVVKSVKTVLTRFWDIDVY